MLNSICHLPNFKSEAVKRILIAEPKFVQPGDDLDQCWTFRLARRFHGSGQTDSKHSAFFRVRRHSDPPAVSDCDFSRDKQTQPEAGGRRALLITGHGELNQRIKNRAQRLRRNLTAEVGDREYNFFVITFRRHSHRRRSATILGGVVYQVRKHLR